MTGTVDEIARGQDNLPIISATEQLAWHWMHVLGADHYQFQDEIDDGFCLVMIVAMEMLQCLNLSR